MSKVYRVNVTVTEVDTDPTRTIEQQLTEPETVVYRKTRIVTDAVDFYELFVDEASGVDGAAYEYEEKNSVKEIG